MKIGLLECDHVGARLRHFAGDYRDMFATLFEKYSTGVSLRPYDVINGGLPASIDECDGFVATGSRFSAYDDEAWIKELKEFVRRLAAANRRFVGICFGHQILAEALGGRVARSHLGWGIGVHEMNLVHSESWMKPPLESCSILYSHRDQVEELPENGVLLGSTPHCPVAMFRAGQTMLGVQGHPEFTAEYAEALVHGRADIIGRETMEAAVFKSRVDDVPLTAWIVNFLSA